MIDEIMSGDFPTHYFCDRPFGRRHACARACRCAGWRAVSLAGFAHPLSGFDHLLAMVTVGLWGAFLGRPLIVLLPVVFPSVMALGAIFGMINVPMPPIEIGIALSVLALGSAVALAWRAPVWLAVLGIAVFAIFHGYAHGAELPSIADPIAFSLGFVLATGMLHVLGIAIGLVADRPSGTIGVRVLGGLIAGAGLYYLAIATGLVAAMPLA